MNFPTSNERLNELMGKFEAATTDGKIALTSDDIGDTYSWFLWIAESQAPKPKCPRCDGVRRVKKPDGLGSMTCPECRLGDGEPSLPPRTYEQGRLDQFLRMKKERPLDPVYWDMHEENRLRAAVEGL